jgi:hypothetical protein
MTDRRQERNERIAEILGGTDYDRRSHTDADCQANPGDPCCRTCGRPLTEFEREIYRTL